MLHVEQNPDVSGYWNDIARRYEAAHPGVKVELQYLENEAYKKKLTTLLQSPDRPNIIYSWGGGVLREQVKAGVIEDLSPVDGRGLEGPFQSPAAMQAYTLNGKVYGVPMQTSQVGFFYNKDLFAKAGVDAGCDQDLGRSARRGEEAAGGRHRRRSSSAAPTSGRCTSTGRISPSASAARTPSRRRCAARARASRPRPSSRRASSFKQLVDLEAVPGGLPRRHLSAVVGTVRRRQGRDGC